MLTFIDGIPPAVVWSVLVLLIGGSGTGLILILAIGNKQTRLYDNATGHIAHSVPPQHQQPYIQPQLQHHPHPQPQPQQDVSRETHIFCTMCGIRHLITAKFCPACGVQKSATPKPDQRKEGF